MKPDLSSVTLVSIDGVDPDAAADTLYRANDLCRFKSARLFTFRKPLGGTHGLHYYQIPKLDYANYARFVLKCLNYFIQDSTHILIVQPDSGIIHPDLWNPDWLQYDYIGAPWPQDYEAEWGTRIGNSGFSLWSTYMLYLTAIGPDHLEENDDIYLAKIRKERKFFADRKNINIAPLEVASVFSQELVDPGIPTFGFHKFIGGKPYKEVLK